jgi:hypothetical protein
MAKRILAFLAFSLALFITPCWSQTPCGDVGDGSSCFNSFSPGVTTGVYDFGGSFNGRLVVQFDTVLTSFDLTVTLDHNIDPTDPKEFPTGTACVKYTTTNQCVEYDFSGASGGPNGVPVKNKDYKGLITLTLTYDNSQPIHTPAFGHAPGDNATAVYTENILTAYFEPISDPTMGGKVPNLSAVAAFDEPLNQTETDSFCGFTAAPQENNSPNQKPIIEIAFKLVSGTACTSGTPIRDKTATISVAATDSFGNFVSFPPLMNGGEGNKFHWDSKNGVNEYDISTESLPSGTYTVTVFSSNFSPQSTTITVP